MISKLLKWDTIELVKLVLGIDFKSAVAWIKGNQAKFQSNGPKKQDNTNSKHTWKNTELVWKCRINIIFTLSEWLGAHIGKARLGSEFNSGMELQRKLSAREWELINSSR